MPELRSWSSTSHLLNLLGACSWLGLMQRTKCELVARSVRIRSSSCFWYLSATKPARFPPPLEPPVKALIEPTEKRSLRMGAEEEDMHSERSSCSESVFFLSQPAVWYMTEPAKCAMTNASFPVSFVPAPVPRPPLEPIFGGEMCFDLRCSLSRPSVMDASLDFGSRECSVSRLKMEPPLPLMASRQAVLSSHSTPGQTMPSDL
mmetsp:Transcript_25671/g.76358  ORF Transcript_25671/g.76358 Transcript_25671/m.76358 type:complete len:204 (-) Transcript_25671:1501-2112(-)